MTDPATTDSTMVLLPASSPTRSAPSSPRRLNTPPRALQPSSPPPSAQQTPPARSLVTDLLDIGVPEFSSEQQVSSTEGESHEGDDDTDPSSTTPVGDEQSHEEEPSSIGRIILNTRKKRVGTIIDVSEDTQVYNIEGSVPDEDTDIFKGKLRPLIYGYLHKLGRNGKWQRRFFETDGECLTYYKSDKRTKILASLDLCKVGTIAISPSDPVVCTFVIQVVDRPYSLRAENKATCKDWVITLNRIKEARLQVGGVKLVTTDFHQQPPDLLSKDEPTEIAPRVVLSANRQRTRAVDGVNVNSWESLLRQENKQNTERQADVRQHHAAQSEILARWQKRRSMLYSFSRAAVRWARSIRQNSCSSSSPDQVVLDTHLHPPGHDDARSSASTNSDVHDTSDSKLQLEPSWPSPPPALKPVTFNIVSPSHEIT